MQHYRVFDHQKTAEFLLEVDKPPPEPGGNDARYGPLYADDVEFKEYLKYEAIHTFRFYPSTDELYVQDEIFENLPDSMDELLVRHEFNWIRRSRFVRFQIILYLCATYILSLLGS